MIERGLCALAAVLLLTACGGGGGGSGPATDMPEPPTASEPPLADGVPSTVEEMFEAVGESLPDVLPAAEVWFGSTSLSTGPDVTGVNSSFDDGRTVVTVERGRAPTITFDSTDAGTSGSSNSVFPSLTNRSLQEQYHFSAAGGSARYARVVVDWNNDDPTDYAVGGYWMHADADSTDWEVGAFVAGPELSLSDPPSLPVSGSASYFGAAGGFYAVQQPGSAVESGHFDSTVSLVADFAAGTVEGCLECGGDNLPYSLDFGTVPFDRSDGTFQGSNVTISHGGGGAIAQSSGQWAGQFSNVPHRSGEPRLAAGTFGSTGTTADGTSVSVIGAFGASRN